ncbi:hypothetical protein FISHEDRAFT_78987 [Fistulina hepatica ATCC 64428]|uniref:Uncharacterized protein n=1 Tax=Fistulina hepatica ATCC 64428 TaxID=1128425 RepID=A0A0D6ZZJ0_9AGAR|nr:hypothetical protein FISHEDRAFT_78987 [Fistulina hepatica ATCC 64428]
MNSPPEPASPISSGSDTPPPEPNEPQPSKSVRSSAPGGGSFGKRRFPGSGSFASASSTRDPKSRRRDDPRRGTAFDDMKERKEKDEMVDVQWVDFFRKELGDPFASVLMSRRES